MSRYGWSSHGGHGEVSPFTSLGSQEGVPAVTDEDFSYITSEDLENHGLDAPRRHEDVRYSGQPFARSATGLDSRAGGADKPADDVLIVKHKGIIYPEHFPAFSIGDGLLNVDDLRERVRIIMDLSKRRAEKIRMLYKGKQLKDLSLPVREYGVKNNSEIMVVIPEGGPDSSEESSEEIVIVGREDGGEGTQNKPKRRNRRGKMKKSPRNSGSKVGLNVPEHDRRGSTSRGHSPSPGRAGVASPGGPIDQLNTIGSHFTTKLLPLCVQFTANPPSDPKKMKDEHRKLSETVMQQVILKLDGVDTGGDESARARRKELVRQVQDVLNGMDKALQQ